MCETWAALMGVLLGGILTITGTFIQHWLASRSQNSLDGTRKNLLRKVLTGAKQSGWMTIGTLSQVIGADLDETRRLLIQIDARGSTGRGEVWSLISRNPLPETDDA